jgi:hypothetical protein
VKRSDTFLQNTRYMFHTFHVSCVFCLEEFGATINDKASHGKFLKPFSYCFAFFPTPNKVFNFFFFFFCSSSPGFAGMKDGLQDCKWIGKAQILEERMFWRF